MFKDASGGLVVDGYLQPIHYEADGQWVPISNELSVDPHRPGWVRTTTNSWTVGFGPATEGVELVTSVGSLTMRPHQPAGGQGRPVAPTVQSAGSGAPRSDPTSASELADEFAVADPSVVEYPEVWPGASLRYTTTSAGVKEDIVVARPGAGARFSFEIGGAELMGRADGGLEIVGPIGDLFAIPAPTVVSANGEDLTTGSGARYVLGSRTTGAQGPLTVVTVEVDAAWLDAQPATAFPLVIDPAFDFVNATANVSYGSPSGSSTSSLIRTGRQSTGTTWRAGVRFNTYEPYLTGGYRVYNAQLQFQGKIASDPPLEVYNQGAQPTSFSAIGTGKERADEEWFTGFVTVSKAMDGWVTSGLANQWFGIRGVETGTTYREYSVRLILRIYQPPQPSLVTNLSDGQVLTTTTPTLQSQPVPFDADGTKPWHEFQLTTSPAPNSGLVVSSGMLEQTTTTSGVTWTVPQGSLQEGQTYWAWVLTDYAQFAGPPPQTVPPPSNGRRFTVDLGLGDGGPSPTDQVGSAPGDAQLPSEGAPGPGVPAAKVTVNLVDGNLSMTTGTKSLQTLSGPLALSFTYNSLAISNNGLRGEFFNDTNASGQIDAGDVKVGARIDPTVSFDLGSGILAKAVAAQDPTKALARWEGFLTVPTTGTWEIGAVSSDGIRATVGGITRLDNWTTHEPESAPVFGSAFAATAGSPVAISIDWRNTSGRGVARMYLRDVTSPSSPITYNLSPAWLTRSPATLPTGWAFNAAAGAGRWVGLEDNESSVSVFSADGTAHEFKKTTEGAYTAPLSAPNDLLSLGDEGRFVLEDAGGTVYTFRSDGVLESLDTTTDDLNPAGLTYGYSGTPTRLRTITDPVSGRSVTLSYVGDAGECTSEPVQAAGLLCRVTFWDGTSTTLSYDTSARLISITNPGTLTTQLGYDSTGRLDRVRDPLALEAVIAGLRANDLSTVTQIAYDPSGRVASVTQPSPAAGGLRPQRTYTYSPASRIGEVDVAGFSPSTGYAQRVVYDVRNRITESRGSDGLASTYTWDASDRLVGTTDPAGLRTTTVYDHASRPVTTYGPAPAASFQANGLPVAGEQVPTTSKVYDGGISGLAAAYWSNPFLAGGPSLHDTGLGTGGEMYQDWGSTPPVTPGSGGWSSRYSGYLNASTTGSYVFQVQTRGSRARVWVDEVLVVDHTRQPEPTGAFEGTVGSATTLSAGQHRIRVDHVDTSGPAGLEVSWQPPGAGTFTRLPGSVLTPGYGLVTSMTDPDGRVTATDYTDTTAGIGPHHRLATATVEDPGGLALRTSITYETPGAGSYLRRVARTLPAGNTWSTVNYGGTEGPVAAVCGVSAGTPQGGQPRRVTGPDPDGAGPGSARVEEFVYDAIGRRAGRRVAILATLSATGWQCSTFDTRGRLVTQSWPAHDGSSARTITHTFAVGGNPLVNQVSDTTTGKNVSATVDLLGRTVSYTDVWGATNTTVFDQPGRMTSATGPSGTTVWNFDPGTGRATTTVLNGSTLATPSYNPTTGRLTQVSYGNSTSSQWSYDAQGRPSAIAITDQTGQTGETRSHSLGGRLMDQQVFQQGIGLVDANPTGANFAYDGAGRLTQAQLPGGTYMYGYGASPGCAAPDAGDNTNRSTLTVTGAGATSDAYCYNHADQLTSTASIPAGEIDYDDHGNTLRLGEDHYEFDAADRHIRTETPTSVTRYLRDPLDRLAERTEYARISHVDTTTAVSASASITINRPAGTQPDDVIVASISAALAPPALSIGAISASGWSVLADRTNLNGRTFVLSRQATATDPASWTFTASGSRLAGALSSYRNVDTRRSITAVGTASTSTATSHPFPQVTTGTDAQHLVHVAGFAPDGVNPTTPAGTTQRAKITAGPALLVIDRYQSHPGTAPVVAATTGLPNSSVVATLALAPKVTTGTAQIRHIATTDNVANADTITISRPAGTQAGDTIIASISGQGAITPGNLTAAGWSLIADRASTGVGASARTYVLTRYATGSDPGSWSFTAPNATNLTGALSTYRGPAGGWPITAVNTTATASATSHPFPQVTTGYGGHHLVHVMGVEANTASAAPAGTTQRASRSTGIGALGSSIVVADRALPSPGTSTVVNGTTATAAPSMTLTVALAPAITAARYSYSGHNDNPEHVLDVGGSVIERNVALPGNTTYTTTPTGATHSHANAHGDTVTITDPTGQRIGTGHNGPYGEQPTSAGANTTIPNTAWGWHGQQGQLTDGGIVHMGARPYSSTLGRFLRVDPVEGGCANDYTYGSGDPISVPDLSGMNALCDDGAIERLIDLTSLIPPDNLDGAAIFAINLTTGAGMSYIQRLSSIFQKKTVVNLAKGFKRALLVPTALGTIGDIARRYLCDD